MTNEIDARGLSCPQPVLMTLNEIKRTDKGELVILVDNEAAKENTIRAASGKGWEVGTIECSGDEYRITIRRS
jgi:tRNA 2-thiouridine synthesizing protein A